MIYRSIRALAMSALLLSGGLLLAQPAPILPEPQDEPEPLFEYSWYTVEIIVFAWDDRPAEAHHRSAGAPDLANAIDPFPEGLPDSEGRDPEGLQDDAKDQAEDEADRARAIRTKLPDELVNLLQEGEDPTLTPPDPRELQREAVQATAWLPLEGDALALGSAWSRLQSNSRTRPLVHLAWHQPEQPLGEERRMRLRGGNTLPESSSAQQIRSQSAFIFSEATEPEREIDGSVALAQGRYLHLDLDLFLRQAQQARSVLPGSSVWRSDEQQIASWHISERRRVRPDLIHYFDHERFGVIALIRQFEPVFDPPEPSEEEIEPSPTQPDPNQGNPG